MTISKAQPRTCHEATEGKQRYSSTFSLTSALDGARYQCHALAASPQGRDLGPFLQEAGRAPGPIWMSAENLAHSRIQPPNCPAHIESLYRLHYHK